MYKSYKAYTGNFTQDRESSGTDRILAGINDRHEEIISVTAIGLDHIYVLIITKDA